MSNIQILVVDDESRMRKLVKDFLQREGYSVLEAVEWKRWTFSMSRRSIW